MHALIEDHGFPLTRFWVLNYTARLWLLPDAALVIELFVGDKVKDIFVSLLILIVRVSCGVGALAPRDLNLLQALGQDERWGDSGGCDFSTFVIGLTYRSFNDYVGRLHQCSVHSRGGHLHCLCFHPITFTHQVYGLHSRWSLILAGWESLSEH